MDMVNIQMAGGRSVGSVDRPIVEVRQAGRCIGLYRVRAVGERGMLLSHGGISWPVGTELTIEDIQRLVPGARAASLPARVVRNDVKGIAVTW